MTILLNKLPSSRLDLWSNCGSITSTWIKSSWVHLTNTGLSSLGVPCPAPLPPRFWQISYITQSQPRKADYYAHKIILAPLDFQTFQRSCRLCTFGVLHKVVGFLDLGKARGNFDHDFRTTFKTWSFLSTHQHCHPCSDTYSSPVHTLVLSAFNFGHAR